MQIFLRFFKFECGWQTDEDRCYIFAILFSAMTFTYEVYWRFDFRNNIFSKIGLCAGYN